MGLNNTGDTIGLWSSFADYSGDHETHANVVEGVTYDDSGGLARGRRHRLHLPYESRWRR